MAMPFLNYTENSLNLQKFKNKNPKNSNLNSFWAFLLSVFIYISVFYIFNLSPSTLLCTTKFWFVISNTLILIIAADFGTFSSSREHDFFDEYGRNNARTKSTLPSFEIQCKTSPKYVREETVHDEEPQEKIIGVVAAEHDHIKVHETLENKHETVETSEKDDRGGEKPNEKFEKKNRDDYNGGRKLRKRRAKTVTVVEPPEKEGRMALMQRTLSERHEEPRLEENEFSRMSDEELNRRVEDFIRRCNRQIRLQAASNRRQG